MKKKVKKLILTLLFLLLCAGMLLFSKRSLYYALTGLQLWFNKMVPALLPFMILSNLLIGLDLTDPFVAMLRPVLGRLFRLDSSGIYALFTGFLCGFPMGAKVTADLVKKGKLSLRDASYLLAFCNNIGPVYFTGFVLMILHFDNPLPYFAGMYGLALLYGLLLRRLPLYRPQLSCHASMRKPLCAQNSSCDLSAHHCPQGFSILGNDGGISYDRKKAPQGPALLDILDDAIMSALFSITKLGGYMIFFNLLNLLPDMLFSLFSSLGASWFSSCLPGGFDIELLAGGINCLLEITSGISRLQDTCPLLVLVLLPFGGFSCIAQTYSMIKETGLSIRSYILHKIVLTLLTLCYYLALGV